MSIDIDLPFNWCMRTSSVSLSLLCRYCEYFKVGLYLDDILNINYVYFDNMVSQIYPSEPQLNKTNTSDTEAAFLDLHSSISNDIVSTKIYDKRDDFDFEIVHFPTLVGVFLVLHPMESISLNSFVLLEHLALLLTSTLAINC